MSAYIVWRLCTGIYGSPWLGLMVPITTLPDNELNDMSNDDVIDCESESSFVPSSHYLYLYPTTFHLIHVESQPFSDESFGALSVMRSRLVRLCPPCY